MECVLKNINTFPHHLQHEIFKYFSIGDVLNIESYELVKMIIESGWDLTSKDLHGYTLLHLLCGKSQKHYIDTVKLLIANGVDVNDKSNCHGFTPLHLTYDEDLIKLLIMNGADINAKDHFGNTPLDIAYENDDISTIRLLIDNGADVNAVDKYLDTPLHLACLQNQLEMVKFFLESGADTNIVNGDGITPFQISLNKGHIKIIELFNDSMTMKK